MTRWRENSRAPVGLVLIGLGVMFLLDTLNVFGDSDIIGDYWPTLLIAWGLWQWSQRGFGWAVGPLLITGIGVTRSSATSPTPMCGPTGPSSSSSSA